MFWWGPHSMSSDRLFQHNGSPRLFPALVTNVYKTFSIHVCPIYYYGTIGQVCVRPMEWSVLNFANVVSFALLGGGGAGDMKCQHKNAIKYKNRLASNAQASTYSRTNNVPGKN